MPALIRRRPHPVGSDQNRRTAMELLGVRGNVVGPQRGALGPGSAPRSVVALARDMIGAPQPMSCRRAAEVLGASRDSIWRWRMAIIGVRTPEADNSLAGIVDADDAHQRESRKGSREWVRHRRDPASHPAPPRLRAGTVRQPRLWRAGRPGRRSVSRQRIARATDAVTGPAKPSPTWAKPRSPPPCCP